MQVVHLIAHIIEVVFQVGGDHGGGLVIGLHAVYQLAQRACVRLDLLDDLPCGFQLRFQRHGILGEVGQRLRRLGQRLGSGGQVARCRLQCIGKGVQIGQGCVGILIDMIFSAGNGAPRVIQAVQAVGGGVQTAAHAVQGVQNDVQTVVDGVVGVFDFLFGLAQVGDLIQLSERGGNGQEDHAGKGEIVAAHPDGEVLLLSGHDHKEYGAQVADELDLGARRLQGENIVRIEGGRSSQDQIVPAVCRGGGIGQHVQIDLHQAGLAGQIFSQSGSAVELIGEREGPGQIPERLLRFPLEVETLRPILAQLEGDGAVLGGGGPGRR